MDLRSGVVIHPPGADSRTTIGECETQALGKIYSRQHDTDLEEDQMDKYANIDMIGIVQTGWPTTEQTWQCMASVKMHGKIHIVMPMPGMIHIKTHGKMEPMLVIGPHQVGLITPKEVGETMIAAGKITLPKKECRETCSTMKRRMDQLLKEITQQPALHSQTLQ